MRMTNEIKGFLKKKVEAIYEKKLNEATKNFKSEEQIRKLFLNDLNKTFKANLKNCIDSFEKKNNISFLNKDLILDNGEIRFSYMISFNTKETEEYEHIKKELRAKCNEAYENLIINLSLNKEIKTIEEELQKIENSL